MKAALEDGYEMAVNPETGIANFQAEPPGGGDLPGQRAPGARHDLRRLPWREDAG